MDRRGHVRSLERLAPLSDAPLCSIVLPCWNEERHIEAAVRMAMAQAWPRDRLEILVVDGRSTDRTRAIVANLSLEDERIVLLDNPGRFASAAMNRGLARARGDVIVRMGARGEYATDYVATCVRVLRDTDATAVGGGAFVAGTTLQDRAERAASWSLLGMGGWAFRNPDHEGFVESVCNEAFRREAFETVGLFDPEQRANEEAELNQRILEAGGAIYLSRDLLVRHQPRRSLRSLFARYFAYGQGRAWTLLRRGRLLSPRPVLPAAAMVAFSAAVLGALLAPGWSSPAAWMALSYAAALVAVSVLAGARARDLAIVPLVPAVLATMHAAHALGMLTGLCRFGRRGLRHAPLPTLGSSGVAFAERMGAALESRPGAARSQI